MASSSTVPAQVALWLLLAAGPAAALAEPADAVARQPLIDAHSHYTAADAERFTPADIVSRLDAAGVRQVVISGMPPQTAQVLYRHAPGRVLPFLGVYSAELGKSTWMHDAQLPQRVRAQLGEGHWVGLGELHIFARDACSPVLEALVHIAVEHRLILLIHGDVQVIDRIFAIAPEARVLWAHLGTLPVPALVDETLQRHSERALWVDTSVRDERIAPGGRLLDAWRQLFERHPQRFVAAVDAFSSQRWQRYAEVVGALRTWIDTLPEPLARRLMHDNAEAMLRQPRRGQAHGQGHDQPTPAEPRIALLQAPCAPVGRPQGLWPLGR